MDLKVQHQTDGAVLETQSELRDLVPSVAEPEVLPPTCSRHVGRPEAGNDAMH